MTQQHHAQMETLVVARARDALRMASRSFLVLVLVLAQSVAKT